MGSRVAIYPLLLGYMSAVTPLNMLVSADIPMVKRFKSLALAWKECHRLIAKCSKRSSQGYSAIV